MVFSESGLQIACDILPHLTMLPMQTNELGSQWLVLCMNATLVSMITKGVKRIRVMLFSGR